MALQLSHVGRLLMLRLTVTTPDADNDAWLTKFWQFRKYRSRLQRTMFDDLTVKGFGANVFKASLTQ